MSDFSKLGWVDDFIESPGGISLKERIAVLTEKAWVTIHGHPVNIGGGSSGGSGGGGGAGNAFHGQVVAAHTAHHTYDPKHPDPATKVVHINKGATGDVGSDEVAKVTKAQMFNQGHMSFGKVKDKGSHLQVRLHTAGTNSEGIQQHLNEFHRQTGVDPSKAKSYLRGGDLHLEFPKRAP